MRPRAAGTSMALSKFAASRGDKLLRIARRRDSFVVEGYMVLLKSLPRELRMVGHLSETSFSNAAAASAGGRRLIKATCPHGSAFSLGVSLFTHLDAFWWRWTCGSGLYGMVQFRIELFGTLNHVLGGLRNETKPPHGLIEPHPPSRPVIRWFFHVRSSHLGQSICLIDFASRLERFKHCPPTGHLRRPYDPARTME